MVKALIDGLWALILPVFILVGLRSGKFTPTEAGVIAAVYALVIGLFVYKEVATILRNSMSYTMSTGV